MIEFNPLIEMLINVLYVVLTGAATWGLKELAEKLKIDKENSLRVVLNDAVFYGIDKAVAELRHRSEDLTLKTRNEVVAATSNYVITHTPKALKQLGLSEQALAELIMSRLGVMK